MKQHHKIKSLRSYLQLLDIKTVVTSPLTFMTDGKLYRYEPEHNYLKIIVVSSKLINDFNFPYISLESVVEKLKKFNLIDAKHYLRGDSIPKDTNAIA